MVRTDRKNICRILQCLLWGFLFLFLLSGQKQNVLAAEPDKAPVLIEYFGYNTCAACSPEEDFYAIIRAQIGDLREEIPYTIYEYNTFHQEDKKKLSARREELGIPDNNGVWPVMILGDRFLIGLDEVELHIRELLLENGKMLPETNEENAEHAINAANPVEELESSEKKTELSEILLNAVEQQLGRISAEDSVILYFSTLSCQDCLKMKKLLDNVGNEILLDSGKASKIKICEINIAEEENVPLLWQLFEKYNVSEEEQMVPILFFQKGFLPGVDSAEKNFLTELKKGNMQNFSLDLLAGEASGKIAMTGKAAMALTGFINGLNPCGASMLLMLLAAAMMLGTGVLKIGITYLAGKFLSYFAMGFGLYQLLLQIDHGFLTKMSQTVSRISAAVFLLLAIMYFIDFWNVRKKEYGKIRMQLPAALRKWNHKQIEKFTGISGKKLLPAIFLLGIIISAGEFFCTGQVYLAAILYMMKENAGNMDIILTFLIYITAMCIPSLILIVLIDKTGNVIRTSNRTLEWMPAIKLLTALVFFAAACAMLFS